MPFAIEGLAGVTEIETSATVTVRVVEPLIGPEMALMLVVPELMAVASPPEAMLATAMLPELQVTELVRF